MIINRVTSRTHKTLADGRPKLTSANKDGVIVFTVKGEDASYRVVLNQMDVANFMMDLPVLRLMDVLGTNRALDFITACKEILNSKGPL